jgi:tRNA(fMet)-specific endonuclease VapC
VTRLCLDTSAYSHLKRGEARTIELLGQADWVGIPVIVVGELLTGFREGSRFEKNTGELSEFLQHPVVSELPATRMVAECYSELLVALRAAGSPLPTNDIWIAATSHCAAATLLTFDQHFSKIAGLSVLIPQEPPKDKIPVSNP